MTTPLRKQFSSRPDGDLEGVTSKVEFWSVEGKRSVYLTVNFMRVQGTIDAAPIVIERPVEFFVPAGQLLSMVARSGGSVAKALVRDEPIVKQFFYGKVMESCFLGTRCRKFLPILKAIGIQAKRENCHVPNSLKDELDIVSLQLFLGKVSSHQRRSI